jgi:hypothetical protein
MLDRTAPFVRTLGALSLGLDSEDDPGEVGEFRRSVGCSAVRFELLHACCFGGPTERDVCRRGHGEYARDCGSDNKPSRGQVRSPMTRRKCSLVSATGALGGSDPGGPAGLAMSAESDARAVWLFACLWAATRLAFARRRVGGSRFAPPLQQFPSALLSTRPTLGIT